MFKIDINNNKKNKQPGFSLIEVIVVTAIVTLAFMAIVGLVRRTVMLRSINQDNLVASQLAAEGIELVKNVRNENWLQQESNAFFKISNNNSVKKCSFSSTKINDCDYFTIDYFSRPGWVINSDFIPEESGHNYIHFRDKENSFLSYTSLKKPETRLNLVTDKKGRTFYSYLDDSDEHITNSKPTIFHRIIRTSLYQNYGGKGADMLEVQAIVYWQNRGKDYYYILSAELYDYDWYY